MATPVATADVSEESAPGSAKVLLEQGDQLTREEFERRYQLLPQVKKAELIEGTVYMPSPVRVNAHGKPHSQLATWLGVYAAETAGVETADNLSVRLDLDNEPQPDLVSIKSATHGGQTRVSADDYLEGAPELVVEVVGSSRAYDLHQKKDVYRRNGVREYLAWNTGDCRVQWWALRQGEYQEIPPSTDGLVKSGAFPGLWLDTSALLRGDMKAVLAALRRGLESRERKEAAGD